MHNCSATPAPVVKGDTFQCLKNKYEYD
jgi:hypothetical protein